MRWIDDAGIHTLLVGREAIRIEPFGFAYEEDFTLARVELLLVFVPNLGAVLEAGGDAVCAFCKGRFVPDLARTCSHCGGRMI